MIVVSSDMMRLAASYRDKAINHCKKQEYFDVLTYASKCSKIFKVNEKDHIELIAFNQHSQAIDLLNEVIMAEPERV